MVETPESLTDLLQRFTAIKGPKVLVHGGGRTATQVAAKLGIESHMINGRRVTDKETLDVVTMVYAGLVNKTIVARLQAMEVNALGLTGADLGYMRSEKRPVRDVDYGFVGDVKEVRPETLIDLLNQGVVPVLAPLTHDGKGQLLNTNADTIAGEAAKALAAHFDVTLVYCFEKKGVLFDENDEESVIPSLTRPQLAEYIEKGIIQGGMIPKLENAFEAIDAGVTTVVITRADALVGAGTVIRAGASL